MSAAHTTALQRIEELALSATATDSRDRDDWKDDMLTISGIAHEALQQPVTDSQKSSPEQQLQAENERMRAALVKLRASFDPDDWAGDQRMIDVADEALGGTTAAPQECGNFHDGTTEFEHVCRKCGGTGVLAAATAAQPLTDEQRQTLAFNQGWDARAQYALAAATAAQPQPDTLRKAADVLRRVYRGDAVVASEIDSAAEALEAMVGPAAGATGEAS